MQCSVKVFVTIASNNTGWVVISAASYSAENEVCSMPSVLLDTSLDAEHDIAAEP